MEIKHFNGEKKGQFEAYVDQKKAGFMSYKWSGKDNIIIEHTEVQSGFEGKGIGRELVLAGVEYARKNTLKIEPKCSYAKKFLERSPDYEDVLI